MKKDVTVRSSAAEYLTFITASGESQVEAIYFDENVWLTQKMMGVLYDVEANTITYHLQKAFRSLELDENSVTRKFRVTASDGKSYDTKHYNLKAIISVGNKVDSPKAVQFRKWANNVIEEYTIKGFAKNYLSKKELANMGRLVNAYLDLAELQAERNIPMTMKDWENRLNGFLQIMDYGVLSDNGKVSAEMARIHAESEFEKYRKIQDVIYESDFDRFMELEDKMKNDSDREQ